MVKEHIDAAEVVGGDVHLLTIERYLLRLLSAEHLDELKQQGARTAGRVIHLVYLVLAVTCYARQQLSHLLRGEELATALAGVAGIHGHKKLIRITEGINLCILQVAAKVHGANLLHNLRKQFVALAHRGAQLRRVHVDVREQSLHVRLAVGADGRALNVLEDTAKCLVEVVVILGTCHHILEQFGRVYEETLLVDGLPAYIIVDVVIRHVAGIVKAAVAGFSLLTVEVCGKVFGNKTVEEESKHIVLEVPTVNAAAKVIGNLPDGAVQLSTFLFFTHSTIRSVTVSAGYGKTLRYGGTMVQIHKRKG